jgi:hypothetical protein
MVEFIQWLTGTHTCDCGAKYKVTVTKPIPGADHVHCVKCGVLMDSWRNKSFLAYEPIVDEKAIAKPLRNAKPVR